LPRSFIFLFLIFRARGERALITYTIEAIRDMSTEILRTEKDMATHKKYVYNLFVLMLSKSFALLTFMLSIYNDIKRRSSQGVERTIPIPW
jgi:hypothetical protein